MPFHRFTPGLTRLASLIAALALTAAGAATQAQTPQGAPNPGPTLATPKAPAKPGSPRVLKWDELVPAGWDPMKDLAGLDMAGLSDADPRAAQMMKKMREVWDNAPTNPALEGQAVRIPGFVVPLEETKDGVKEFLLVPYFGACIHSPPPPSNQIIHVLPRSPAKGVRSMDAVWISGTLTTSRTDSYMGASSYRIEALSVEPYTEKPR
jgi:uncharacterized protein